MAAKGGKGLANEFDFLAYNSQKIDVISSDNNEHASPPPFLVPTRQLQQLPVAMSLRARECGALSLKHIFDQMQHQGSADPTGDKTVSECLGIQSASEVRKPFLELDLSFQKHNDISLQSGFGSPISINSSSQQQHEQPSDDDACHVSLNTLWDIQTQRCISRSEFLPRVDTKSRPAVHIKQPHSQLTIFYSGIANVYDNVPIDRAHAIMLLAGTSSTGALRMPSDETERHTCITPSAVMELSQSGLGGISATSSPQLLKGLRVPPPLHSSQSASPVQVKTQIRIQRPHIGIGLEQSIAAGLPPVVRVVYHLGSSCMALCYWTSLIL